MSVKQYCIFWILTCAPTCVLSESFKQEMASIDYVNEKYLKDLKLFTSRRSRNQPYLTNLTTVTLISWGDNVTVEILIQNVKQKSDVYVLTLKACECIRTHFWIRDFLTKNSDMDVTNCMKPNSYVPAGPINFYNMELPPKNMPFLINNGDYKVTMTVSRNKHTENIGIISIVLRAIKSKKS